jgi:membrane dipeptidase
MIARGRVLLSPSSVEVSTRAADLVWGSMVVDMLGLLTMDWGKLDLWQAAPGSFDESEYRRLEATGIDVFHPAVERESRDPHGEAERRIAGWKGLLEDQPCFLDEIDSFARMTADRELGRLGVLVGMQNSDHFRTARDVEAFYRLGQRVSQLTYNTSNRLGSGCLVANDRGLTPLGAEVVGEMNRLGMAIDVSHCGERTSLDAIRLSKKPVLVTHANCRALVPHQLRNKSDKLIEELALRGGVVGITMVRGFVHGSSATLAQLLDHFDHVARVAGIEHVGLGSDLAADAVDPRSGLPWSSYQVRGLDLGRRVFQVADGLLERGYTSRHVELVLGGNFLRALGEIGSVEPWAPLPDARETRRDPFCPAPRGQP